MKHQRNHIAPTWVGSKWCALLFGVALGAATIQLTATSALALPELSAQFEEKLVPVGGGLWQIELDIALFNTGPTAATNVWLMVFQDLTGPPDPAKDAPVADTVVDLVAPGAQLQVPLKVGPLKPGPVLLTLTVDPLNLIAENNKSNNIFTKLVELPQPQKQWTNLRVAGVEASVDGHSVSFTAWVENEGTVGAGAFTTEVYLSPQSPEAGALGHPFVWVPSLAPGQVVPVTLPAVWLPAGAHTAWVTIDPQDFVAEAREDDNSYGPTDFQVVSVPLEGPDAFVSSAKSVINEAGQVIYVVDVHNAAEQNLPGPVRVQLYHSLPSPPSELGLSGDQNYDFPAGIAGKSKESAIFLWDGPPQALHESWIVVKSLLGSEINDQNNFFGPLRVDLAPPAAKANLKITRFDGKVNTQDPGNPLLVFEVDVTNAGDLAAGDTDVVVYPGVKTLPDPLEYSGPILVLPLGAGLAPGQSRQLSFEWTGMTVGVQTAFARVDPLNLVLESSQDDNSAGPLQVQIAPPPTTDLLANPLKAVVVGSEIRLSSSVLNSSAAPAGSFEVGIYFDSPQAPAPGTEPSWVQQVNGLVPGESRGVVVSWTPPGPGTYRAFMVVDWKNQIAETNENNNLSGPAVVEFGQVVLPLCADKAFAAAECRCGAQTIDQRYCCSGAPQLVPCDAFIPDGSSGGGQQGDASAGSEGGGFNPFPPADSEGGPEGADTPDNGGGGGGGCRQASPGGTSGTPVLPLGLLFGALAMGVLGRNTRRSDVAFLRGGRMPRVMT